MLRLTWGPGEGIIPQGRHIAHTGLRGDLVQDFAREYFRAEDCGDLFAPELVNQARYFTRGRFRKIRWLYRSHNGQTVASGKVRPGVVIGEELALVWGQGAHGRSNALVQMRQLVPVANEVPTLLEQISTAARRTGLDIADVTPLGVIAGDVFDTYRYRMGVTGSYHRIAQFLDNIGSLTRIVAPMNLSLLPTTRDMRTQRVRPNEALLDASFEIQTYVAKTAPPPATGSSAGTATKGP